LAKSRFDAEFDVVVVGAGSAGCVLSARLSENSKASICLIEAGGHDRNPWIHIPIGYRKLLHNEKLNWGYETEPEPGLGGRKHRWPRGKVVGGSGSINGLVYLRGAPSDFDEWERLGALGWRYRDILPYFNRMECCIKDGDVWRRNGGSVPISKIKRPSTAAKAFVETCERLQYPHNGDFNGERIDGVGFVPLNVYNGWRYSTAVSYLKPNLRRPNLQLMTATHACRILFEGRRAVGVEVEQNGEVRRVGARHELVLSGGAINSPVLLLASGVGPAGDLSVHGIDVKLDLPGVGKNLQDHYQATFAFGTNATDTADKATMGPVKSAKVLLEWLFARSGPLTIAATEATLFAFVRSGSSAPDLQYQVLNFSVDGGPGRRPGLTIIFNVCRPRSRGEIKLRDPKDRQPRILGNYLTHPYDMSTMVAGFRIARQIAATEPFHALVIEQVRPSMDIVSDEQIAGYVRETGSTTHHPCGTCRMGEDDGAVVDSQLRVRGIEGLRVVDASVMPVIPSTNIHAATIMVAEKASDLIARSLVK
jgi:choline dehydrogenase